MVHLSFLIRGWGRRILQSPRFRPCRVYLRWCIWRALPEAPSEATLLLQRASDGYVMFNVTEKTPDLTFKTEFTRHRWTRWVCQHGRQQPRMFLGNNNSRQLYTSPRRAVVKWITHLLLDPEVMDSNPNTVYFHTILHQQAEINGIVLTEHDSVRCLLHSTQLATLRGRRIE